MRRAALLTPLLMAPALLGTVGTATPGVASVGRQELGDQYCDDLAEYLDASTQIDAQMGFAADDELTQGIVFLGSTRTCASERNRRSRLPSARPARGGAGDRRRSRAELARDHWLSSISGRRVLGSPPEHHEVGGPPSGAGIVRAASSKVVGSAGMSGSCG